MILRKCLIFFITLSLSWSCAHREIDYEKKPEYIARLDLPAIKERGHITVSMDNNSTGYFIYRGKTMGYEYELLKRYADEHGLELMIDVNRNLKEAFNKLNRGETDILAYNLTITKERKERIAFTNYHNLVRQVLVQRKPDGWQKMHPKKIDRLVLRNPVKLIGKKVYVRPHSAHETRLQNLSEEIGGDILIRQADPDLETEDLIRMVAEGEIDYTIAEADIATVNARYHPNIDVETAVSFPQRIAWGIRKNAPELRKSLNKWLADIKDGPAYTTIYNRYFKKRERSLNPENEFFAVSEVSGGKISPYDDLIRDAAADLGWDWRLLAAQIYKESQFNPKAVSWAGAQGLMQLMPGTALAHNVTDPTDPNQSIKAGKRHLKWLQNIWKDKIEDPEERIKFILASYNVGQGHVMDARALAQKYGHSGQVWDDEVEAFLLKKSQRKYYSDPVVKYGYCKGKETVLYVKKIFSIYESYLELISA